MTDLESRAREAAERAETIAEFRKILGIPHDQALPIERFPMHEPMPFDLPWEVNEC